jgi:hypothetical protein
VGWAVTTPSALVLEIFEVTNKGNLIVVSSHWNELCRCIYVKASKVSFQNRKSGAAAERKRKNCYALRTFPNLLRA